MVLGGVVAQLGRADAEASQLRRPGGDRAPMCRGHLSTRKVPDDRGANHGHGNDRCQAARPPARPVAAAEAHDVVHDPTPPRAHRSLSPTIRRDRLTGESASPH